MQESGYLNRFFVPPEGHFFLLGPRGTGKSTFLRQRYPEALWIDLLRPDIFTQYSARPEYLEQMVRANPNVADVIIDEIQLIPELLNAVHRLIELRLGPRYILTGSSARKLKRSGVNLLAGRAVMCTLHPFMLSELDESPHLDEVLKTGLLPIVTASPDPIGTLRTYVSLYIQQEVFQRALIRKTGDFSRFLEIMSFSHGELLNVSNVARAASVPRNTVNSYLQILEDILLAFQLDVFKRRAGRKLISHPKFYFFDSGVFSTIRPSGYLDKPEEIGGAALEGFVIQHFRAWIAYRNSESKLYYWRSRGGVEVDIVIYGPDEFYGIEIKNSVRIRPQDLRGLKEFKIDYPESRCILLYRGEDKHERDGIRMIPVESFLRNLKPDMQLHSLIDMAL
jgi:predicted AAA+ superfamily ATPase